MNDRPLRLLFVKERMAWPRASGHDVHTYYMMRALAAQGHAVALATLDAPPESVAGARLETIYRYEGPLPANAPPLNLNAWELKFCNYWGIEPSIIRWVGSSAQDFHADAVIVSGLRVLPYLGALPPTMKSVWYAADEWVLHHLSQVKLFAPATWKECRHAIDKGLYERAYRKRLDRVWVVSPADARAFRWFAGVRKLDVLPNGVDAEHFAPGPEIPIPQSCVFWGRLDFGPNVQALEWFLRRVWPVVKSKNPEAIFDVFGFQPTPEVIALCQVAGVTLTPDLPDLRSEVRRRAVVVLPFISGGGIKNKLLEAAALGRPILATPRTVTGLNGEPPIAVANSPAAFANELVALWNDPARRTTLDGEARTWVMNHHTWDAAARTAAHGLTEAMAT